jgi:hypothetical protein
MQLLKKCFFIIPVFLFYWIGGLGLNYGPFWTERDFIYEPLHKMVRSGILLPGYYIYPSFYHWPCLAWLGIKALSYPKELSQAGKVSAPDQNGKLPQISTAEDIGPFQERLDVIIESAEYQKGVRWIFLGIAGLSMIWIYALACCVTSSRGAGWLAQGLLLGSWHFMFHSRWVAVDAGVASFGILVVWAGYMALTKSSNNSKLRWLILSSCAVGLATGCKYPGGIFILAPLFVVWFGFPQLKWTGRIFNTLLVCFIFVGTFLFTTPAVILDAGRFWRQLVYVQQIYSASGWGAQTVNSFSEHLRCLLEYLAFVQLSPYLLINLLFFGLALLGGSLLIWKNKIFGLYFLIIPLIYGMYFTQQKTFIVRNYILFLPFIVLMIIYLINYLNGCFKCNIYIRYGFRLLFLGLCILNIHFNWRAANLISVGDDVKMADRFISYYLKVKELSISDGLSKLCGIPLGSGSQRAVLLSELPDRIPATSIRYVERQFGAEEIDLRYYPIWNKEAIVILSENGVKISKSIFNDRLR